MLSNQNTPSLSGPGLPGEEYARLKGRYEVGRVYSEPQEIYDRQFSTETNITPLGGTASSRTEHNAAYMPSGNVGHDASRYAIRSQRELRKSQTATATRVALRYAFESSQQNSSMSDHQEMVTNPHMLNGSSFEHEEEQHPVPARYIEDFRQKWYEDDEDHDPGQLLADMTSNTPWRMHAPIQPMIGSAYYSQDTSSSDQGQNLMEKPSIEEGMPAQQRLGGQQPVSVRPAPLQSHFSWSTTNSSSHDDGKSCCLRVSKSTKESLQNCLGVLRNKK